MTRVQVISTILTLLYSKLAKTCKSRTTLQGFGKKTASAWKSRPCIGSSMQRARHACPCGCIHFKFPETTSRPEWNLHFTPPETPDCVLKNLSHGPIRSVIHGASLQSWRRSSPIWGCRLTPERRRRADWWGALSHSLARSHAPPPACYQVHYSWQSSCESA